MHIVWKISKIILFILLGLVILLFVAGLFIEPMAERLLIKEIDKAGKGQYTLKLEDVKVSLLRETSA